MSIIPPSPDSGKPTAQPEAADNLKPVDLQRLFDALRADYPWLAEATRDMSFPNHGWADMVLARLIMALVQPDRAAAVIQALEPILAPRVRRHASEAVADALAERGQS